MKRFYLFFALIFFPLFVFGQNTSVTATLTDSDGNAWANGSYTITFDNPSQGQPPVYTSTGQKIQTLFSGSLNGSGALSVSLPDNMLVTPRGSWDFKLCSNTSGPCTVVTSVTITGSSMNLTTLLSGLLTPPRFSCVEGCFGYSTIEVSSPQKGENFYNVTTGITSQWNGTAWTQPFISGTTTSPQTMAGPLNVPTLNNVCNAYAQNSTNPNAGITACQTALPAGGGIIDATGYSGSYSLGALTITKAVVLKLGSATFDVTSPIEAINLSNLEIEGNGTVITCDTGAGKACLELVGTSGAKLSHITFNSGTTTPSTIGVIEGRTTANPNTWRTHFSDVVFNIASNHAANPVFTATMTPTSGSNVVSIAWTHGMLPGEWLSGTCIPSGATIQTISDTQITISTAATSSVACSVTAYAGSIAIYNYGAENTHYENVTLIGDSPLVLSADNILNVTPTGTTFYGGATTMSSVVMDGKSDVYGSNNVGILSGAGNVELDYAEADGSQTVGGYGIIANGSLSRIKVTGEFENLYRGAYIGGYFRDSNLSFNCTACLTQTFNATGTWSSASTTITPSTMTGWAMGDVVIGTGIPRGTYVTALNTSTLTINQNTTGSGTGAALIGMEPMVVLDGGFNGSGVPITLTNSDVHIAATYAPAASSETYYIEGIGANYGSSTGWTVWMPIATDILWPGSTLAGTIFVPAEGAFNYPLLPATFGGTVVDSTGNLIQVKALTFTNGATLIPSTATGNTGFPGNVVGSASPVGTGNWTAYHWIVSGHPTIACGTGAGSAPTVCTLAANSTDEAGIVNVTTGGTAPATNSTVVTLTLANTCPNSVIPVISPTNANTADPYGTAQVFVSPVSATQWQIVSNTAALINTTAYQWSYHASCN